MEAKKIVVACGGTGGHIFPGLVVANELRRRGYEVEVWLSGRSVEDCARRGWDGTFFVTGMRQISLRALPYILRALVVSFQNLRKTRPALVIAMGSYSSLPPVLIAKLLRVPIVLHEANAVPGKAVDFLSRYAAMTAISFEESLKWLVGRKVCVTGLPIRGDLIGCTPCDESPPDAFTILITGGSQGARRVNELMMQALRLLRRDTEKKLFVIHQCGRVEEERIRAFYAQNGIEALVSGFFPEMGRAYAAADFVVCRAGAATCFELALLGKPALFIPLPNAARDHQRLNALAFARGGGADVATQSQLTPRSLARYLKNKLENPALLQRMSCAIALHGRTDAGAAVATLIENLLTTTPPPKATQQPIEQPPSAPL